MYLRSPYYPRTTDTQWRHKSKISEKLGRCGRQNMLPPYLKIWDWDWIFGRAVKAISSLGVRSPCYYLSGPCPTTKDNILLPKNRTNSTDICLLIWICILAVSGLHTDLEQEIILLTYEYNEFLEWGLNLRYRTKILKRSPQGPLF
jgi:hypothetical protein